MSSYAEKVQSVCFKLVINDRSLPSLGFLGCNTNPLRAHLAGPLTVSQGGTNTDTQAAR